MARNGDAHPTPDDPNEGPTPHFPPGMPAPVKDIGLERPGKATELPGSDYPPARKPFPDHTVDPGVTKP
jgi:hypothetical protein